MQTSMHGIANTGLFPAITKASVSEEPGAGSRSNGEAQSARRDPRRGGWATGRPTLIDAIFYCAEIRPHADKGHEI